MTLDTVEDYKMQKLLHDACLKEPIDFKKFNRELFDNAYTNSDVFSCLIGFKALFISFTVLNPHILREFMKIYTQPLE